MRLERHRIWMQNYNNESGDHHHACQDNHLTPPHLHDRIPAPPTIPECSPEDNTGPGDKPMIAFERSGQEHAPRILPSECIEHGGNHRPAQYDHASDPNGERDPLQRETDHHPPTEQPSHSTTAPPDRSQTPLCRLQWSYSPDLLLSTPQTAYCGSWT